MKFRLPKTRRYRFYIYLFSTLLILFAIDLIWVRIWRHIPVGHDTTRITGPLKPDGTPDYIEYLNARAREGVTPENNAAIPLMAAFGPDWLSPDVREKVCTLIGAPVPAPGGQYFHYFEDFFVANHPLKGDGDPGGPTEDELVFCRTHPWSASAHPDIAAWLVAIDQPLALYGAASSRARYYVPFIPRKNDLVGDCALPSLGPIRALGLATLTRAMLHAQNHEFAAALADLLAVHRMARLQAQGITILDHLVALAIDSSACDTDAALAGTNLMPAAELRQLASDIDALPPLPSIQQCIDNDRFGTLDALAFFSRHTKEAWHIFRDPASEAEGYPSDYSFYSLLVPYIPAHFTAAMRNANAYYDNVIANSSAPTYAARESLQRATNANIELYTKAHFIDPAKFIFSTNVPALGRISELHDRSLMKAQISRLAIALAQFHADHSAYPDALAALVPAYVSTVPPDLFIDQPLHYAKLADGFLLYSVGINAIDDGGLPSGTPRAPRATRSADDIVIRVPAPDK